MTTNHCEKIKTRRGPTILERLSLINSRFGLVLTLFILSFNSFVASANDTIPILLSERKLLAGDTLSFDYSGNFKKITSRPFTLHLWIDHLQSKRTWKLRYPIINSTGGGDLILSDRLPEGQYALNFLFDSRFFELSGSISNYKQRKKTKLILIDMITSLGTTTMEFQPSNEGSFSLPPTLFQDTCVLLFGYDKNKSEDIYVNITSPLDSFFIPFHSYTTYMQVGKGDAADTVAYRFDKDRLDSFMVLPEVVVTGVSKRNVELFDEEFSSTMFKNDFATLIDGLSSDIFASYPGILQILQSRIPGLTIKPDSLHTYSVRWRGLKVSFYLDEFLVPFESLLINTADIAMIKAIPPPANIRPLDPGGAIAIYTKRGKYESANSRRKSIFKVVGYTPSISVLQ